MGQALYYNPTDGGILAAMMLVMAATIVASLFLFLKASFRYVRSPMNVTEHVARWNESKRRRKWVRRHMVLIAFSGFTAAWYFLHAPQRTMFSLCLLAFFASLAVTALIVRARWSSE